MGKKSKYSELEAMEFIFKNVSPSELGKSEYDKIMVYKGRYEKGILGEKAKSRLLEKYGFKKHAVIYYTKVKSKITDDPE